ncbi:MAG: DEAD/DEAH box helicase family protein [Candidatus Latescibacteria bacterium]|nr:DEAD/DEAH box helicase family protein [Candidatus Latescibacterota bacterium]
MQKEAKARIKINKLLELAGWRLLDSSEGSANVLLEPNVKLKDLDDDYTKINKGFVDYLLLDENKFPVCVLEAKSEDKDPMVGKEQARHYANSQNVRYIILSNGNIHYFWDIERDNPTRISFFPSLATIRSHKQFTPDTQKIVSEIVNDDYIVLTQNPNYQKDPRWHDESQKSAYISQAGLKFLRPYQAEAVKAVQRAVAEGKNRFLLEMATGTGKTLVAGSIIKLYLKTGNARRVLFLVDRLELENQAKRAFDLYLKPDYKTVIFKENRDDWQKAEVIITTVQSISFDNKYLKIFSPTDFDLIISDEAHRSISGNSRLIFEYFLSAKLGLTATPKDYLKNVNFSEEDPRELERRILLSTYKTFGCESGIPTFRYALPDGVKDGYLVNPKAIDCRTEITTQLLSDEGYAVMVKVEETDEEEEKIFKHRDFERKFFSEKTNYEFCKTFLENANRDPITGEIGKTIIFCVSRKHATKITDILNKMAHQAFPDKYNSDFAIQITSDIPGAQEMTINFANNNLSGWTKFINGYKSSKTRVCVTVGMMTTGYDCEDILNLCLMRPIFSPTDFVQIKGRGTRIFTFKHTFQDIGLKELIEKKKADYKLFDFFANCEYFEEKYQYDQIIALPPTTTTYPPQPPGPIIIREPTAVYIPDPLKTMEVISFKDDVMRVDRELYMDKFEKNIHETYKTNNEFKDAVDSGNYELMEKIVQEHIFNKPEEYFSLDNIRRGYQSDRRLKLWEILDKIFGKIKRFKTKSELADEEFEKYVVSYGVAPNEYYEVRELFRMYLVDNDTRYFIDKNEFGKFAANPNMLEVLHLLKKDKIKSITSYIKDNVNLNIYA